MAVWMKEVCQPRFDSHPEVSVTSPFETNSIGAEIEQGIRIRTSLDISGS